MKKLFLIGFAMACAQATIASNDIRGVVKGSKGRPNPLAN